MKRFISIAAFIAIVALLFIAGCSTTSAKPTVNTKPKPEITLKADPLGAYTYDGEFDPVVFFSWTVVRIVSSSSGHIHIFLKNPDQTTGVDMVETLNARSGDAQMRILAYRYMKDGEWYIFSLDGNHYKQVAPKTVDKSKGI